MNLISVGAHVINLDHLVYAEIEDLPTETIRLIFTNSSMKLSGELAKQFRETVAEHVLNIPFSFSMGENLANDAVPD